MAGATDLFEADLLDLLFTNVAAPNVGDAAGLPPSVGAGTWGISLHTATLVDTDTLQSTSEAAYTGYVRQTVVRSVAGWTISGTAPTIAANDSAITYPISTSGPESELDVGLGSFSTPLLIYSVLDATLVVNNGVTPEFAISALAISLD